MITEKINLEDKAVVSLSGGVATRNSFVVFDSATTEQLIGAVKQVTTMEGALAWWLGDLGLALQERKRNELAGKATEIRQRAEALDASVPECAAVKNRLLAEAEELENGAEIKYRDELCIALGIDAGYWANCVRLARFYPPSSRGEGLKPKHFRVVQDHVKNDPREAQEWLARARAEGLTAADLRKTMAESKAIYRAPELPPEQPEFDELCRADKWASRYRDKASKLNPSAAAQILTMTTDLRSFLDQIKAIANLL